MYWTVHLPQFWASITHRLPSCELLCFALYLHLTSSTERRDGSEISLPYLSVVRSHEDGDRGSSRQSITPGQRQRAGGDGWVCLQPGSLARYYHRVSPTQLWAILSKLWHDVTDFWYFEGFCVCSKLFVINNTLSRNEPGVSTPLKWSRRNNWLLFSDDGLHTF